MCMLSFSSYFFSNQDIVQKHNNENFLIYTGTVDAYTMDSFVVAFVRHFFGLLDEWHSLLLEHFESY